ncbi:MAG: class I SAM-dependent methyltransferase [Anaerolineae bacterium]|nr:class I SAM-dependent methyltransferase [Anaerolineae bacterium]
MSEQFYDTIARFYDAENENMTEDLPLYRALVDQTGDPVLDVGCGTGRVMLHLAQAGYRAVGLDRSEAMLVRGERKLDMMPDLKPLVTFVRGDALDAELADRFKLILVPYNGFMHFNEQDDQLAALRRFAQVMAGDGLLVLDMPNAGESFGTQDDGALVLERTFVEPESGYLVMQHSVSTLDRITQQLSITWIYDEVRGNGAVHRTLAPLLLRYVFPGEMDLMLAVAGLRRVETYGDYDRCPFEDGSPRMIVLAERDSGAGA